jgi:hypothetical protein
VQSEKYYDEGAYKRTVSPPWGVPARGDVVTASVYSGRPTVLFLLTLTILDLASGFQPDFYQTLILSSCNLDSMPSPAWYECTRVLIYERAKASGDPFPIGTMGGVLHLHTYTWTLACDKGTQNGAPW